MLNSSNSRLASLSLPCIRKRKREWSKYICRASMNTYLLCFWPLQIMQVSSSERPSLFENLLKDEVSSDSVEKKNRWSGTSCQGGRSTHNNPTISSVHNYNCWKIPPSGLWSQTEQGFFFGLLFTSCAILKILWISIMKFSFFFYKISITMSSSYGSCEV